ncbi:MAG: pyruvate formate-lyase-activating protein [Azospirillaceae bacterium]|nr:pyruvate formate-lyase-activating protein [Azospirillaceae bacterium]
MGTETIPGWTHSIETGSTVDGPGIRFVLFLSGCALRCQYCHNPDSWHLKEGEKTDSAAIVSEIKQYADFLRRGHGGVTLSGGEPLVQAPFTRAVFHGCKQLGLHTALDTSGYLGALADDDLLHDTDLVLLDIKSFNPEVYRRLTGVALAPTLTFARRLAAMNKPIWLRYVLVPGLTDNLTDVAGLAAFAATLGSVQRVDVLPFHQLGSFKWNQRNLAYKLADVEPPTPELTDEVRELFRAQGFRTT